MGVNFYLHLQIRHLLDDILHIKKTARNSLLTDGRYLLISGYRRVAALGVPWAVTTNPLQQ